MIIQVWSDYVCPFCYIGKKQLELAIEHSGYEGQIEVQYKSFLLDPSTPVDTEESIYGPLAAKYNMSIEKAKEMTQNVAARAKEVDLHYDFDRMKTANTIKAHRLAKWAEAQGKGAEINERLLQAHFLDGLAIGRIDVLVTLAEEVGLNGKEAKEMLEGDEYKEEMYSDIEIARQLDVRGVPFFVIDNKYGISGAQPQHLFEQTVEKAAVEAGLQRKLNMVGEQGSLCEDGVCDIE
ncbi:DsbA family oxidoreductase [Metasolibacillus meyeri]|uniref:DsbA family oxidoreductase n=1 Tax=Metasolibacillus meyeri TaxID=1071052 RepID=A0AAW9NNR9_9BACL|nr:DsbA family oxidoreductase [Metasolibacillus meyeri]MEC1178002.1 DsbA family oxidoreductase [Metasolibacillus meyeri]